MNVPSWLLWGFVATLALTILSMGAEGAGLTRMSYADLLGLAFTPNRDRAKVVGFATHMVLGLAYSLVYVLIFQAIDAAGWWRGSLLGIAQGFFVLIVVMKLLPALHPRMASEQSGPSAKRVLEPPGFLALHYGVQTPLVVLLSHGFYGAILGGFYRLR